MDKRNKQPDEQPSPDGRGKRPTDPNQLAKWVVEQSVTTPDKPKREDQKRDNDHA